MKLSIFNLLVSCAFLAMSPTFAMEEDVSELSSVSVLQKQVENVASFVSQRKAQGLSVSMVMGARNTECDRISGEEWIFLDGSPHDPQGKPYIQASFNDVDQLTTLAKGIGSSLNRIVVDASTFKFSHWEHQHMRLFTDMLKPDGEFLFPCDGGGSLMVGRFLSREEIWPMVQEQNQQAFQEVPYLRHGYMMATVTNFTDIVSKELEDPHFMAQIEETAKKYEPLKVFTDLGLLDFMDKAEEMGLEPFPKATVADEEKLKLGIAKKQKQKEVDELNNKIMREIYIPYVIGFLEQHFEEVVEEKAASYPFPTNFGYGNLISAKRPKAMQYKQ